MGFKHLVMAAAAGAALSALSPGATRPCVAEDESRQDRVVAWRLREPADPGLAPDALIEAAGVALTEPELARLSAADGETYRTEGAHGWIARLPALERTCVVWQRRLSGGGGLAYWTGSAWEPVPRSRLCLRYDHTPLLRELCWVVEPSPGDVWLRMDPGAETDLLEVRPALVEERTRETLLERGPGVGGLSISGYSVGQGDALALGFVADNRLDQVLRGPFRTGRLRLLGRCGKHTFDQELRVGDPMKAVDLRPGGLFADGPLHAFGFLLRAAEVPTTPPATGEYELRFVFEQRADAAARKAGIWTGRVESNPFRVRLDGWVDADAAVKAAGAARPRKLPSAVGTTQPAPAAGEYVAGDWTYVVRIRAAGTRSEAVTGELRQRGRLVVPERAGHEVATPFGKLVYEGQLPPRAGLLGYRARHVRWGRGGWLPPP